jgi:hypothetical protein
VRVWPGRRPRVGRRPDCERVNPVRGGLVGEAGMLGYACRVPRTLRMVWSAGSWHRAEAGKGVEELLRPWPVGREVQQALSSGTG